MEADYDKEVLEGVVRVQLLNNHFIVEKLKQKATDGAVVLFILCKNK